MSLDYGLSFEQMRCLAEGIEENAHEKLREKENMQVEVEETEPVKMGAGSGDRSNRGGVDLLHSAAYQAIDFHKSIADIHRGEEYARDYIRVMEKLNKKWKEKELARHSLPTTFPDEIRANENLTYKKGGSRRRAYTGCEAAEANEAEQRRVRRKNSIEQRRRQRHSRLLGREVGNEGMKS